MGNDGGMHFTLAECRALWAAISVRLDHLSRSAVAEEDEDKQLALDEEVQDLDGIKKGLMTYARSAYGWEIEGEN